MTNATVDGKTSGFAAGKAAWVATHGAALALGAVISFLGAAATGILNLHGAQLAWTKQTHDLNALKSTPFDVSDKPEIQVVKQFGDRTTLYRILFTVSAKNESDLELPFSWSMFTVNVLSIGDEQMAIGRDLPFDAPPDPYDGYGIETPVPDSASLKWKPVSCVQHYDPDDDKVQQFLKDKHCGDPVAGGGMTGSHAPSSTNSYTDGILIRGRPGDFLGLSKAFGVNDCIKEDSATCSLMQEIVRLP